MKIYLVTSGCYSDYGVDGIFSSRELAEKMMYIGGFESYNDIEEVELDDPSLLEVDAHYEIGPIFVSRIYENGGLEECGHLASVKKYRHPERCKFVYTEGYDWEYNGKRHHNEWHILVYSPISQEHANKVAVEKRQEKLRTGDVKLFME